MRVDGDEETAKDICSQVGGGERTINISSVREDSPMLTTSPYRAAKGAVRMLVKTIVVELDPHGQLSTI